MRTDQTRFLEALFRTAIDAVSPARCVPPNLPSPPAGRLVVVGAGKAAAAMGKAVEDAVDVPVSGTVVVPYGHGVACSSIEVIEAAHPVPDAAAETAARKLLATVSDLGRDDLVLALVSGGGSALLVLPAPGLALADKQAVNRALLASGAAIDEINAVRRALSAIKGGRLAAAAHPARVVTLVISDVPGDNPAIVASGPTIPPPAGTPDPAAILAKYGIKPPPAVAHRLASAAIDLPQPGDPAFARDEVCIVARAAEALAAAAGKAREAGCDVRILGDAIEGEARSVGEAHAALALGLADERRPGTAPIVVLSGGETTVTLGSGSMPPGGGRNTEYLRAMGLALNGDPRIWAIACDTDGIDGGSNAAGALLAPQTVLGASEASLDPTGLLAAHRSADVFDATLHLIVTGPTYTNVNDFRAILIGAGSRFRVDL
jgi:glycerate 2-kinase